MTKAELAAYPEATVHSLLTDAAPGVYRLIDEDGRPMLKSDKGYLPAEDAWVEGEWQKFGRVDVGENLELPIGVERAVMKNGRRAIIDWILVERTAVLPKN